MEEKKTTQASKGLLGFLVVVAFLCNAAVIVFAVLNATGAAGSKLFCNTLSELNEKYYTEVTPHPLMLIVTWPVAFLWNSLGVFYLMAALCLPSQVSPVLVTPTLTPVNYLLSYIIGCAAIVGWLFAYDRELIFISFVLLAVASGSLWSAAKSLLVAMEERSFFRNPTMLWLIRILLQNGLCFFAMMTVANIFTSFSANLIYVDSFGKSTAQQQGRFSMEDGSTIGLSIFYFCFMAYFTIESYAAKRYFQYTFSGYLALIAYFAGIYAEIQQHSSSADISTDVVTEKSIFHDKFYLPREINQMTAKASSVNLNIVTSALGICIGLFIYRFIYVFTAIRCNLGQKQLKTTPDKQSMLSAESLLI